MKKRYKHKCRLFFYLKFHNHVSIYKNLEILAIIIAQLNLISEQGFYLFMTVRGPVIYHIAMIAEKMAQLERLRFKKNRLKLT